jgi:hypothetical protein
MSAAEAAKCWDGGESGRCFGSAGNRGDEAGQEDHGDEDGSDDQIMHGCFLSFVGEAVHALSTA